MPHLEGLTFETILANVSESVETYHRSPRLTAAERLHADDLARDIARCRSWPEVWSVLHRVVGACSFVLNFAPKAMPHNVLNVTWGNADPSSSPSCPARIRCPPVSAAHRRLRSVDEYGR